MKTKTLPMFKAARAAFVVLLLAFAGLTQVKAQTFTVGDLNYSINDDGSTVTLTGHVDGFSGQLVIPESVQLYGNDYPVTNIGDGAFENCGLTGSLVIPTFVTRIGYRTFAGNNITSLTINNNLAELIYGAFEYCSQITEVTIPKSVRHLETRIFGGCTNLATLNYNAVWAEGCVGGGWDNWLEGTSLSTVNIGGDVQNIPCDFLNDVGNLPVNQIVLPESVTQISWAAFSNYHGLVNIPSSVTTIGGYAFNGCVGLTGVLVLPETLVSIGEYAFHDCTGLTGSLSIPNLVKNIDQYAFSGCSGLSGKLTLGASLENIRDWAFYGFMNNITEVNVLTVTPPALGGNVFVGSNATLPVIVPCGTVDNYQNTSGWNAFANIQESDPCFAFINVTLYSPAGGVVSGAGLYEQGQTCTLTATPNESFVFLHWTENGEVVSTDPEYSFVVESNRVLEAVFLLTALNDDFNDGYVNQDLWVSGGGSVAENNGILKIEKTDYWGGAYMRTANAMPIPENGQLVIDRRSMLHSAHDSFYAQVFVRFDRKDESWIRLIYLYDYNGKPGMRVDLNLDGYYTESYLCDYYFDVWMDEKIVVDFNHGQLMYYRNGEFVKSDDLSRLLGYPVDYYTVEFSVDDSYDYGECHYMDYVSINDSDVCYVLCEYNEAAGSVSGYGVFELGQTCTLTAVANEGYVFASWTENGTVVSTDPAYSFTVSSNRCLTANFVIPFISDDFNDGEINPTYWSTTGSDVYEADGLIKIEQNNTDDNVGLISSDMGLVSDNTVAIDRKFYLHRTSSYYFGRFDVVLNSNPNSFVGVRYYYDSYSGRYGTYVAWQLNGEYYETYLCDAVFDAWLTERTEFDLSTSTVTYYRNNAMVGSVEVPSLNEQQVSSFYVQFKPDSWYSGSYHYMDYVHINDDAHASHSITVSANPEDCGTVSGGGVIVSGQTCTVVAAPADRCDFINWTEDGEVVSTDAEYSFPVTGERNLVANFTLPSFSITATANPSSGGVAYLGEGSSMSFGFDNGTLQGWTSIDADGDGQCWYLVSNNSSVPGHNGSNGMVTSASYNSYALYPDNYFVSPQLLLGGKITFYACAQDAGWASEHFGIAVSTTDNSDPSSFTTIQEWTLSAKGVGAPSEITRSGNRAQGNWYQYSVNLSDYSGMGYIAIRHFNCYDWFRINVDDIVIFQPASSAQYYLNETCTVIAEANYGYEFVNWEENGVEVSTGTEYSFTVNADRNLVANFSLVPFAINAAPNFDDRGSVSGAGEYVIDETCTLTATPNSGHNFVHWMENGQVVSTEATYSFTVDGPHNFVAVFTANVADIIVFADPNVKAICVNNWDTDGDSELTYAEAAAVTDLGNKFQRNYDIASFDELQYFTGLTYINDYEFYFCQNLNSIVLPESITSIGYEAFLYCYSLGGTLTIGENVNYIGWGAFMSTNFSTIHYNAVNCEMGGQWIDGATSSLTTLTIGENVEVIPYSAFQDCYNVTGELVIPNSVYYIGENAFNNCYGLSAVTMPEGITTIEQGAFGWCSNLESINIPDAVETIGNYAFSNCINLKNLVLPSSLTFIGTQAFDYCYSLTGTLDIPDLVTYIGYEAFMGCTGFSELVLPDNIQTIGGRAFKDCSGIRGEITLPEALESISGNAFSGCDGISTVNYNATNCYEMGGASDPVFNDCAIEHINIGANVESIPNFAFRRCSLVTDMHVAATLPPTVYSSTFGMVPRSIPVLVPSGSGDAYRSAQYWEEFFNIMEDGEQYSYYWDVDAHQYAHNLSVIGLVQINGEEQSSPALEIGAFCGDECRGRQMLTAYPDLNRSLVFLTVFGEEGDLITFRLYDHEAEEESTLACATVLTFEADAIIGSYNEPEPLNFVEMQNTAIEAGWTWFSTYIDADGAGLLQMIEESLGENGVMIKSHTDGFVSYDENGWMGNLTSVNPESMYMVNTTAPAVLSLAGPFAEAAEHPVMLSPEWNWIGYPANRAASLNNALSGFTAQDGDIIKMQESFSQYVEGIGWTGALKTLVPGEGLMYHSLNSGTTSLTYVAGAKDDVLEKNITAEGNHWNANTKAYPFNMSVMAVVDLDGVEARDARYELGAFYGDECRGSARLMYVESLDRYLAFVSVSGNGATDLTWLLFDNETKEVYRADEGLHFDPNAILGATKDPLRVSFSGLMGTEELMQMVSCYPNPVGRNEYVHLNMPAVRGSEARVEIMNAQGAMVSSARVDALTPEVKAPATAGVYVMRVTIDGKGVVYAKLIVE